MICPPCREAGRANQLANDGQVGGLMQDMLRSTAERSHERCPGGTRCDCHHFVGEAINKQLVKT